MDQAKKEGSPSQPTISAPARRQRAPTITIDTSGGDSNSSDGRLFDDSSRRISSDLRPPASISESRPTSPHNVSSPTNKGLEAPGSFLAVPGSRPRTDSMDTEDSTQSPSSMGGETIVINGSPLLRARDGSSGETRIDNTAIMNDADALKEDPGAEADYQVDNNKFAFSPGQLSKLFNPKSLSAFYAMGGLKGLEKGLRTDIQSGLSLDEQYLDGTISFEDAKAAASDEPPHPRMPRSNTTGTTRTLDAKRANSYADRKRVFRDNRLPEKKAKSIFKLLWMTYNDKVLILLTIAAIVSLALGLYQTFQPHAPGVPRVEWVEGVAIMIAVLIVVVVGASNDWQKERQFVRLNKKKEDRIVRVIRSGRSREISVYDVLVGDVMHLEPGDLIPVDGVFISGYNVKCDESSATGESDLLKKTGGERVYEAIENDENLKKLDPLIISGGKVSEGIGTFLVTSVGVHSSHGKTMMALKEDAEATPLQSKLNTMAEYIAKLGGAAALLLFIVLLIKFLVQLRHSTATPAQKGQTFLQILIVSITVVVVAVPEGLPLAVTLALAFATTRMLKDNNLVRVLRACETMGNATTICSDKTGTLTQNKMTLVAGTIGSICQFGGKKMETAKDVDSSQSKKSPPLVMEEQDKMPISEIIGSLSPEVKELLKQSIAINSTAFEGDENGTPIFIGSKTETALLGFAKESLGMGPVREERSNANVVQFVPFDSARKCMAAVVRLDIGKYRMYVKGASEILLGACTQIVQNPTKSASSTSISHEDLASLDQAISSYASRSLRTIGLLFRDFEQWPPKGCRVSKDDTEQAVFEDLFKRMTLLGIVGIQDPLRDGVTEAVRACQSAGVFVRMVTGDNIMTARAIAEECGIYSPGGIIMEGPAFRKLSRSEMDRTIPRLQVLSRSSPEDKRTLVKRLKLLGETVAVTGDGTNDAPALKTADVGFSMGIAGTEVAKEASAIILMDDNFSSIVKAIMWGRAVNDAVKKFLQFQVTVNITAVILTFVSAVSSNMEQSVLTAVQLLWVNLIMDTFAALALATDPPAPSILDRKPDPKSAPLITVNMWKMIIGQAIYQLVVTFVLFFAGASILSYQSDHEKAQLSTLVFNTFVWMQIFNQYNNRRLDNKFNIFEGVTRNYFFIAINIIMVAGQIMIVFIGGRAFQVTRLNGAQWGYSIVLGALSLPIAVVIRLIPDELVGRLVPERWGHKPTPEVVISDDQRRFEWNSAMVEIREELMFLKRLRGGRLNALKFKLQNPRETLLPGSGLQSRSNSVPPSPGGDSQQGDVGSLSAPPSPSSRSRRRGRSRSNSAFGPAAAMAGIVAGSIAGWSPVARGVEDLDSDHFGPELDRRAIEEREGIEIHPATSSQDPVVIDPATVSSTVPPSQTIELTPTSKAASDEEQEQHQQQQEQQQQEQQQQEQQQQEQQQQEQQQQEQQQQEQQQQEQQQQEQQQRQQQRQQQQQQQ